MLKKVLPLTGSLYFKNYDIHLMVNSSNAYMADETKIPYRGGCFIIESKNNRYTVVAYLGYLQRQFKNHYYLSSATNSTAVPMNSCFHFFLSFLVLPWGQSDDWRTVTSMFRVTIGTLRSNDADGNENVKKTIGFTRYKQSNNFARASRLLVHFFAVFCATTTWNCLISRYGLCKQTTTNF